MWSSPSGVGFTVGWHRQWAEDSGSFVEETRLAEHNIIIPMGQGQQVHRSERDVQLPHTHKTQAYVRTHFTHYRIACARPTICSLSIIQLSSEQILQRKKTLSDEIYRLACLSFGRNSGCINLWLLTPHLDTLNSRCNKKSDFIHNYIIPSKKP